MCEGKNVKTEGAVVVEKIKKFIMEQIPKARQLTAGNDAQLIENGLLDSLGVLDVVTFLEEEFHISVDDEDLTPENFQSVNTMSEFVRQKQNVL